LKKSKLFSILATIVILAIGSLQAASQIVFGSLGRTPADPDWYFTVAVFTSFLVSTIVLIIGISIRQDAFISRLAMAISAAISCTWLGFYYGGIIGGKNPQIAIATAIGGLLLITFTSLHLQKRLTTIAIVLLGIVSAYALAFLCSAVAVAYLSVDRFWWGSIWSLFCIATIAIILFLIDSLMREIAHYRSIDDRRR
jgi:hypothetical protein